MNPMTPLQDVKEYLRRNIEKGARCPCCNQFAKIYTRSLNSAMVAGLEEFTRFTQDRPEGWAHITEVIDASPLFAKVARSFAKLAYWNFIEERFKESDNGDTRTSGWWRITAQGKLFLAGKLNVSKCIRLYDGKFLGFTGPDVGINDCHDSRFNYSELMARPKSETQESELKTAGQQDLFK